MLFSRALWLDGALIYALAAIALAAAVGAQSCGALLFSHCGFVDEVSLRVSVSSGNISTDVQDDLQARQRRLWSARWQLGSCEARRPSHAADTSHLIILFTRQKHQCPKVLAVAPAGECR